MTITDELQDAVSFSRAAQWLPPSRSGRPVHPSVLARWADVGVKRGRDGDRVYLDAWRVGGTRKTNRDAVERFLQALNQDTPRTSPLEPDDQQRRAEAACELLKAHGC